MLIFLDENPIKAANAICTPDLGNSLRHSIDALSKAYYMLSGRKTEEVKMPDISMTSKKGELAVWAMQSKQNYMYLVSFNHALINQYRLRKETEPSDSVLRAHKHLRNAIPQNLFNNGLYPLPVFGEHEEIRSYNMHTERLIYLHRLEGMVAKNDEIKKVGELYDGGLTPISNGDWARTFGVYAERGGDIEIFG